MDDTHRVSLDALISATEVGRTPGQLINRAASGQRLIVLNQNTPVAALVPIDDLRRLTQLDQGADCPTPACAACAVPEIATPAGHATIGHTATGAPVTVKLAEHTLVVGVAGSGRTTTMSAMLANAHYGATGLEFILATHRLRAPRLVHSPHERAPRVRVHVNIHNDPAPFTNPVGEEMTRRTEMFAAANVENLTEWNSTLGSEQLPELVIIADDIDWDALPNTIAPDLLTKVLRDGRRLGIFLWSFALRPTFRCPSLTEPTNFPQIIALHANSHADSRALIGGTTAADLRIPGQAYLVTGGGPDGCTLFDVTAPS